MLLNCSLTIFVILTIVFGIRSLSTLFKKFGKNNWLDVYMSLLFFFTFFGTIFLIFAIVSIGYTVLFCLGNSTLVETQKFYNVNSFSHIENQILWIINGLFLLPTGFRYLLKPTIRKYQNYRRLVNENHSHIKGNL